MSDPFVGEIRLFGFNFAPAGWAFCNGALMAISQNTALFSLLGTFYGGNGISTFALPDLRSRVALGQGQGPGLSNYALGQVSGQETHALTLAEMPTHNHVVTVGVSSGEGTTQTPVNAYLAAGPTAGPANFATASDAQLAAPTVSLSGNGLPHNIVQPYLALNYCIALFGIFPSRN